MSEMDLEDKVVLVTGGAGGIGFACGKELLRNGVKHLAILDLATSVGEESAKKLNAEFGEGRVMFVVCDVTKPEQFEAGFAKTVETFGGLDIVINNAGIPIERRWELTIDVNFSAVVRGTLLGLRYMGKDRGNKGGVIVNMSSILGLDPIPSAPIYTATKHAVVGLSRSFGMPYHYNKTGIRLLTICPGVTETALLDVGSDFMLDFMDKQVFFDDFKDLETQKPEIVAQGVVRVIRSAKTGTVWVVEGGEPIHEVSIPDRFAMKTSAENQE